MRLVLGQRRKYFGGMRGLHELKAGTPIYKVIRCIAAIQCWQDHTMMLDSYHNTIVTAVTNIFRIRAQPREQNENHVVRISGST